MRRIEAKPGTQRVAHDIIRGILKAYPIINELETHEDAHKAIIRLDLGGFKKGKTTVYSYPYGVEVKVDKDS